MADAGVVVILNGEEKALQFPENFECQLTPTGDLALVEMVADVGNKNDGNEIPVIRQFINHDKWEQVIIR